LRLHFYAFVINGHYKMCGIVICELLHTNPVNGIPDSAYYAKRNK